MARILIIDDDEQIQALVRNALKKEGHELVCQTGLVEIDQRQLATYDLILLDVMMPGKDGFTICRDIRGLVDCPILFLTAKTMEEDLEFGLMIGADDYIKKPFSIIELRARVNAHLRREHRERQQYMEVSGVRFYLLGKEIEAGNQLLKFTKSEYEICELLARNHGQVFSREQIYERIFGFDGESDISAITEHIKNIRKKFHNAGVAPIETVWGIGYKWK